MKTAGLLCSRESEVVVLFAAARGLSHSLREYVDGVGGCVITAFERLVAALLGSFCCDFAGVRAGVGVEMLPGLSAKSGPVLCLGTDSTTAFRTSSDDCPYAGHSQNAHMFARESAIFSLTDITGFETKVLGWGVSRAPCQHTCIFSTGS